MGNSVKCCENQNAADLNGPPMSESRMIDRILKHDTGLVDELFKPYDIRARSIARRFLRGDESRIEDVVQEATMKAYVNLFRLRNLDRFGSWFLTIVRNLAIDAVKRENLYIEKPGANSDWDFDSWISSQQTHSDEPVERVTSTDMAERLKRELSDLDKIYGEPIWMLYFEDKSYNEISEILGKPLGTIKSLIHRGKAILKDRIYGTAAAAA